MKTHELFLIDVFTDRRLAGNPCAVVVESDDLDAATMQAIAREMNLSERRLSCCARTKAT